MEKSQECEGVFLQREWRAEEGWHGRGKEGGTGGAFEGGRSLTWVERGAVVADMQVQARYVGVVGRLLDIVELKILAESAGGASRGRRRLSPERMYPGRRGCGL